MATSGDTLPNVGRIDTLRTRRDSSVIAIPLGTDTTARARTDSVRGVPDSLPTPRVRRDSIKAPIARAELPVGVTAGPAYRWRGDTVLATGALNATDLLDRVPGVVAFRSGYIASAQTASYLGDFRRVRVFRDGVELDPVNPRNGGVLDLTDVQLWQADEVSIEPAPGEIRMYIRTRAPRNTTPQTRVDVATGDQETNLYRAFYGKRFGNGALVQVNAQQFGTGARNQRYGGGGDATDAVVRLGWARRAVSVDAYLNRLERRRNLTLDPLTGAAILPRFVGRRDEGYLRVGVGDPERGVWGQAIADVLRFRLESVERAPNDTSRVLPDSGAYRNQYVVTGGLSEGPLRLSATERVRVYAGRTEHSPALRATFSTALLDVSAYAERVGPDSTTRLDLSARLAPLPWVAFVAGATRTSGGSVLGGGAGAVVRAEGALRVGRAWLAGGRVIRDGRTLIPPIEYTVAGIAPVAVTESRVSGTIASLRGRLLPSVYADVGGTLWDQAGPYRPRYQTRGELRYATNWLRRFPTGEFGINTAVFDEYRSATTFPVAGAASGGATSIAFTRATPSNLLGALLEIRLQSAVISYQIRNLAARQYQQVPGITPPRGAVSVYGVRWEFSN